MTQVINRQLAERCAAALEARWNTRRCLAASLIRTARDTAREWRHAPADWYPDNCGRWTKKRLAPHLRREVLIAMKRYRAVPGCGKAEVQRFVKTVERLMGHDSRLTRGDILPEMECWRCGKEGNAFMGPAHPDGGGTICDQCYRAILGDEQ